MKSYISIYPTLLKPTAGLILLLVFLLFLSGKHDKANTHKSITHAATETTLERLLHGNERFFHLQPVHPDEDSVRLHDAAIAQHPVAVVVCCSDSRVSPELIFDEGIGDLFVVRTAGNIMGGLEIGSIEYAVEHLNVQLIVVMGHENCGAVKAFVEGGIAPGHVKDITDSLQQEDEIKAVPVNNSNRLDDCVKANVLHGIKQLYTQSGIIREKTAKKALQIVGARYDLNDLKVSIIKQ